MQKRPSYIPIGTLLSIAREEGCKLTEKTTCIMVTKGKVANRLYIARTQDVARVNVNGFRIPDPELATLPAGGPVGTFLQVIRFDHPEPQVLANFRLICKNLDTYVAVPGKPRGRPAGFRGSKRGPVTGPSVEVKAEETPAQHAERLVAELAKKQGIAKEMGFPLSQKTIAAYQAKIAALQEA
jgi:hypothetical protein